MLVQAVTLYIAPKYTSAVRRLIRHFSSDDLGPTSWVSRVLGWISLGLLAPFRDNADSRDCLGVSHT
jgi:hypothetical protein